MTDVQLPLVISCEGGTPLAQLAGDVTRALDDLGVAEVARDLDELVGAGRKGRGVIAFDGCASACRARLLEAKRLRPVAALNLAQVGVDAQTVGEVDPAGLAAKAALLLRSSSTARGSKPRRLPRPASTPRTKRLHDVDDYLFAIDVLASAAVDCGALGADAPTLAAHVSRLLAVSRASAGQMLARLEDEGLVERSARKELVLTGEGRERADRAVRRHRLLECFAGDFLGYPPAACFEQARILEGAFDDGVVERLRRALRDPDRCPHGWPIDPVLAREESRGLTVLTALAEGERATVVRVAEQDGRLVARLYALGLTPEAALTVKRRGPHEGVTVQVQGATRRVDAGAAGSVFVRRRS
ncbi:MAG: iron dependent repressor, metal binding and dimerization domain protein [Gaiellaceae bacterium]